MNAYEIIKRKRDGGSLTREEIDYLISSYTRGDIPDYQFSVFLMAVYFKGMSLKETIWLTQAIIESGRILDLSHIPYPKLDKHSTGGVGDKVSLVLAPLIACFNIVVPMISGRALGHTGGTLNKLEAIPGFRTNLSIEEMVRNIERIGVFITGQTQEIVPADRKIYALRDATATVDSIPLIASSIMGKKLAEGIDGLVLDVKTGNGAFISEISEAKRLARVMIDIGRGMGKRVSAVITSMDQPLGRAVGNGLEVEEAIEALKGEGPEDLMDLVYTLAQEMLLLAGMRVEREEIEKMLRSGEPLNRFRDLIRLQGGDQRVIDDPSILPRAKYIIEVKALEEGWVSWMDTYRIGILLKGIGRDPSTGFIFLKKLGDYVERGEPMARIFIQDRDLGDKISKELRGCYKLNKIKPEPSRLILAKLE